MKTGLGKNLKPRECQTEVADFVLRPPDGFSLGNTAFRSQNNLEFSDSDRCWTLFHQDLGPRRLDSIARFLVDISGAH